MARKGNKQREIARLAKVSAATVSRVFGGNARVSPSLIARVRDAAQTLGVQLTRPSRSSLIAFLLCNRKMLHPFHSRVLFGAEDFAASHGYNMVFLSFRYPGNVHWKEVHLPEILERRDSIAGYILAGTNSENLLELLRRRGLPYSVLGNNVVGKWQPDLSDIVWFDDTGGAYEATRHFLANGHRAVWYVGNNRLPWFERRFEGYARAMTEQGLEPRASTLDSEDPREIGYLATKSLVSRGGPVTAILAGDDATAHGVYRALRDCGLEVPRDVSLAGVNDLEAAMFDPPLTSVRAFPEQVGRQMAELVINRLRDPRLPPQKRVIPTELAKRDSTGPASRRNEKSPATEIASPGRNAGEILEKS